MKCLLIPVKTLDRAKERLEGFLTPPQRRELVWSMFRDVCRAVEDARGSFDVFVVTGDNDLGAEAWRMGLVLLPEEDPVSESESVDQASRRLESNGYRAVLRLPADVPLVKAEDLNSLWAASKKTGSLLVPSADGTGTNALLRSPPTAFPSRFGPDSRRLHLNEAKSAGIALDIVENSRIALDIDTPKDVASFLREPASQGTFTRAALERFGCLSAWEASRA